MKCYIATYYKYDNYGTRLQNYALSKILKNQNIEPVTIYLEQPSKKIEVKKIIKKIILNLPIIMEKQKVLVNVIKKEEIFGEFNKKLNLMNFEPKQLRNINFSDSFCIAGSDQIWSPNHLKNNIQDMDLFFLKFAPKEKKFAYAPSFGVNEIPKELREVYRKNLSEFNGISVREEKGKKIILDLLNIDVPIVPDPVFLLTKEEWEELINSKNLFNVDKPYILTYFLSKPNEELMKEIKNVCETNNYNHINISGNHFNEFDIIPAPDGFVRLIDEASFVFTDSFHASAFSIIMDTNFAVMKRTDVNQFSRIETLLKKYKAENCYIDVNNREKVDLLIQKKYYIDREQLLIEREKGLEYINNIICKGKGEGN